MPFTLPFTLRDQKHARRPQFLEKPHQKHRKSIHPTNKKAGAQIQTPKPQKYGQSFITYSKYPKRFCNDLTMTANLPQSTKIYKMGAQGDGDYNDPNRYRTSIPVGDRPPTDDSDDDFDDFDVDDDNDDHDDVGDEEDMDSVFLMQLPVNHDMKFFVHPRASLQQANDNENIVRDIKIEKSNTDDLVDREDGSDVAVGPKAELGVNQPMEEEEEPQPGPSRNRSRDDEKEEDEMRSSSRYFRWWDEFDNSSDGSTDLDNDEQDSVLGGAKKRSRDDLDGNLRLQGDLSLMTLSGHHVHSSKNPASEERAAAKVGDFHVGAQETVEDTQSRENYDKENKSGKKRFKR